MGISKSQEVKEKLKEVREKAESVKSEQGLIEELGEGVQAEPIEPDKPDENFPLLDLSGAHDVRHIVDELKQLPSLADVKEQITKIDAYEQYAREIWKVKKSEEETFAIPLREVEKIEKRKRGDTEIEYIIWKKDNKGDFILKPKTFRYHSITIQDKDEINWLANEKDMRYFSTLEEGSRINKLVKNPTSIKEDFEKYAADRTWQGVIDKWQKSIQDYWITVFKLYFNASDDDIKRMHFDDIVNYGEVALYKGGVKSPKYEGS